MGAQIAQQAALGGIEVTLQDTSAEQLEKAAESNRGHLMRRVEKGKLAEDDAKAALDRVFKTTGDERYRPSAQLEAKVKAGKLGRKTKEGWYKYE